MRAPLFRASSRLRVCRPSLRPASLKRCRIDRISIELPVARSVDAAPWVAMMHGPGASCRSRSSRSLAALFRKPVDCFNAAPQMRYYFDIGVAWCGISPGAQPVTSGFFDLSGFREMPRQLLGAVFCNLRELPVKSFRDLRVQLLAGSCVLHQSVLEQVCRVRRRPLPEQQAGLNEALDAAPNSASGLRTSAASRAWEESRPIAAPICATSLAEPSRSSRAIRDACKLAGTARGGDGIVAAVRCASLSLSASRTGRIDRFSHRYRQIVGD
jgi:hypothetical protein